MVSSSGTKFRQNIVTFVRDAADKKVQEPLLRVINWFYHFSGLYRTASELEHKNKQSGSGSELTYSPLHAEAS